MPLSELVYRLAKGKCDSSSQEKNTACLTDRSSGLENDFVELVWENGLVQSSRARKIEVSKEAQSQTSKIMDKDNSCSGMESKMGRFEVMDTVRDEVPSVEMGLNQDHDMSSWLNCPIDVSLQQDYCHEFFSELGVTVNEHTDNRFASLDTRTSGNQSVRDSQTVSVHNESSLEQGRMTRVSSAQNGDANWPRTSGHQLYSSSVQQCQTSFPYFRSRVSGNNRENTNNSTVLSSSGNPIRTPPSGCSFASTKAEFSTSNSSLMNFSHFSRPAALAKANFQHIGTRAASGKSSLERFGSKDKGSIASSNEPAEIVLIDTFNGLQKEMSSYCHPPMTPSTADAQPMDSEPTERTFPLKQPEIVDLKSDSKNEKNYYRFAESETKRLVDGEKTAEPMVASSSVCSVSSVERVSDEPTQNLQRKHRETEESEGPSEDVEEESVGGKKSTPARRGTGLKRTRAAEVHNLSERRRRDRINEKMRALQELIPNCNKVDKASMLDEAIEYLKTLQLQVQIMSMGAGLYMPSMMLPPVVPHMHMSQFSSMGVGMGFGFGLGMPDMTGGTSGCPMMPVPPMQGAHFAGPPMSGPSALYGLGGSNLQMFGLSGQGHSVPYPCAPGVPVPGGPLLRPTLGLNAEAMTSAVNLKSVSATSSKDNVNSQSMQNSADNSSMNQMSTQGQTTNERIEHSALVQSSVQVSEINENGASRATDGNDNVPSEVATD